MTKMKTIIYYYSATGNSLYASRKLQAALKNVEIKSMVEAMKSEDYTSCGLCERICPKENIIRPAGKPEWQHDCVECLGCLHICPAEAIDYGPETKGRKRYRHKEISAVDLLKLGGT